MGKNDIIHFDFGYVGASFDNPEEEETIIKDALVLCEGTHTDNNGTVHQFPQERLYETVLNTNKKIAAGKPIPLKVDHNKSVLANIGEVIDPLTCRTITEGDITDRRHNKLIGKLGAFTRVEVKEHVDKVKKNLLKHLSPGLDPLKNVLVEVSAVGTPAITGMAMFGEHSMVMTYSDFKERKEQNSRLIEELQEDFNTLIEAVTSYLALDERDFEYAHREALITQAILAYTDDLAETLDVDLNRPLNKLDSKEGIYNDNAYGNEVIRPNPNNRNFSDSELTNVTPLTKKKRQKQKKTRKSS